MLFKTQSASVYGIDAYLVEVEVDVGSARMQDFNVVGLPDNAVKESRERIKSALLGAPSDAWLASEADCWLAETGPSDRRVKTKPAFLQIRCS
jgi:hypothetical protein